MSMRPVPRPKTKMLWLYVCLLALAIVMAALLRNGRQEMGAAMRGSAPGGSAGDTLDVALVYGPMSYYVYADTLGGYNYDLMRLIGRQSGVPMKFWPVNSLEDALRLLGEGRYDLLASLPRDADFEGEVLYSAPLFLDRQVLVQRRRKDGSVAVSSALDLAGDTVHIEKDSPIAGRIRNLCREIGDTVYLVEHPDLSGELLALKVQSGALRYAVVNERVAAPLTLRFSNLDAGSPISFTQFQCVVTADADSALLHRFDTWLEKASSSPEAAELRARYGLSVPRR